MANPSADLELTAALTTTEDGVEVRYSLTNHDGYVALYAFDGSSPHAGTVEDLSGHIYVSYEAPDTAHLKRVLAPTPRGMNALVAEVPAMSRIGPGETRDVVFCLQLPLREHSEYFPARPTSDFRERAIARVALSIGYLREVEAFRVQRMPGEVERYRLRAAGGEQRFATTSHDLRSTLLVRQEPTFERV